MYIALLIQQAKSISSKLILILSTVLQLANISKFTEEMCYKELVQNEGFVDIIGIFVACVKI